MKTGISLSALDTTIRTTIYEGLRDLDTLHALLNSWLETTARYRDGYSPMVWYVDSALALPIGETPARARLECPGDMPRLARVVSGDEVRAVLPDMLQGYSWPLDPIPTKSQRCAYCNHYWTAANAFDRVSTNMNELMHRRCFALHSRIEEREYFECLLEHAGVTAPLVEIPNGYDSREDTPWFVASLPQGDIRIGWRKRVISIEWIGTSPIDFENLFPNENVTKGPNMIHAWGRTKALEYLKRIAETLERVPPAGTKEST